MKLSSTDELQIESGEDRNPGELLHIRFQKNSNQKLKYLEAEPKILGVREPLSLHSWTADRFVCLFVLLKTWMGKSVTIEYLMVFFYCNFFFN